MKRFVSLLLCLLLLCSLSGVALASYSFVSDKGEKLEFPARSANLAEPFAAKVAPGEHCRSIYLMPTYEEGHGVLGTVESGETVQVLAEYGGYYFFRTADGRYGWNGAIWFERSEAAETEAEEETPVSDKGVSLELPEEDEYFSKPFVRTVCSGKPEGDGAIYLIPKPDTGNGVLGKVKDGKTVVVLAMRGDFYFVQTADGRQGWNGMGWFVK